MDVLVVALVWYLFRGAWLWGSPAPAPATIAAVAPAAVPVGISSYAAAEPLAAAAMGMPSSTTGNAEYYADSAKTSMTPTLQSLRTSDGTTQKLCLLNLQKPLELQGSNGAQVDQYAVYDCRTVQPPITPQEEQYMRCKDTLPGERSAHCKAVLNQYRPEAREAYIHAMHLDGEITPTND